MERKGERPQAKEFMAGKLKIFYAGKFPKQKRATKSWAIQK